MVFRKIGVTILASGLTSALLVLPGGASASVDPAVALQSAYQQVELMTEEIQTPAVSKETTTAQQWAKKKSTAIQIKKISPKKVDLRKAKKITVTGKNLQQVKKVQLGNKKVGRVKINRAGTRMTFYSPKMTKPGTSWLKINGKQLTDFQQKFGIRVSTGSTPSISAVSPKTVYAPGSRITIKGKKLQTVTKVLFNGKVGKNIRSQTAKQLTVKPPKGVAGTKVNVQVITKTAASALTSKTVLKFEQQQANKTQNQNACSEIVEISPDLKDLYLEMENDIDMLELTYNPVYISDFLYHYYQYFDVMKQGAAAGIKYGPLPKKSRSWEKFQALNKSAGELAKATRKAWLRDDFNFIGSKNQKKLSKAASKHEQVLVKHCKKVLK